MLNPGDVSVTGITGGNYGPVTISGSGTSNVITLAKPIAGPDRVTITIGNAQIATYTRRLDVLPGDVNDDGAVNTTDGVLILPNFTPANTYNVFDDMNGDGAVNTTDFTLYRPSSGRYCPRCLRSWLRAAKGLAASALLSSDEVGPVLTAAIEIGPALDCPPKTWLCSARHRQITGLPAGYLGTTAIGGSIVYLSADAAGYGWSVNLTFSTSPAADHEDLLTVLMHELGHTLGLSDLNPASSSNDLMAETLATGVRRLPSAQDITAVLAGQVSAGQTAPLPTRPTNTAVLDAVLAATESAAALPPTVSNLTPVMPTIAWLALSDVVAPLLSLPVLLATIPGVGGATAAERRAVDKNGGVRHYNHSARWPD